MGTNKLAPQNDWNESAQKRPIGDMSAGIDPRRGGNKDTATAVAPVHPGMSRQQKINADFGGLGHATSTNAMPDGSSANPLDPTAPGKSFVGKCAPVSHGMVRQGPSYGDHDGLQPLSERVMEQSALSLHDRLYSPNVRTPQIPDMTDEASGDSSRPSADPAEREELRNR